MAANPETDVDVKPPVLKRALQRERAAREQAERLLEDRSRELYHANNALKDEHERVRRRNLEIEEAHSALQAAQAQLVQNEKLASVGQLAAGVAHEINNPVGFIKSNLGSLRGYADSLIVLTSEYRALLDCLSVAGAHDDQLQKIRALEESEDIQFILDDMGDLIGESLDGTVRVAEIVQGLKNFSRIDDAEENRVDIHEGIESTLKVVANELKYKCDIRKEFGELPPVRCNLAKINQVLMNLLVNAGQAIEEQGTVTIRTFTEGDYVRIEVGDTGSGIPADKIGSIFDPFFTTKPVGSGTGLGLSISYVIVEEHGGTLTVASELGVGTTFTIRLPIDREASL
ncbi:MAG: ATP-binding protein [Pseudomonadota bacterium]